jgi:hypothetical protein
MTEGGPVAAISVCRDRAPEIATRLSQQSGARVSRTALRVRNPANAPDELQRALLEQFASELASGKFAGPLEAAFEINRGGQVERRYMRAIPMEVFATCHGKTLAPIAAAIAAQYPDDRHRLRARPAARRLQRDLALVRLPTIRYPLTAIRFLALLPPLHLPLPARPRHGQPRAAQAARANAGLG